MERRLLSALALTTALAASAQLAPRTDATLYTHLVEVNKEWLHMDPSALGKQQVVHFNNDTERIAAHLHLVREALLHRTAEGLSAEQLAARMDLLNDLERYADRGVFPQNHVLPYRNPVFIDPHGTACAVGQLMIESGHADLAQRIDDEMELAYVHDMHRADVDAWAVQHGFTEDELAWIQPGYPPSILWEPLGGGTDARVSEVLELQNGQLLVAGDFNYAGSVASQQVAIWDGSTFTTLGDGVDGDITCAIEFDGDIILGGNFNGFNDLATWDGDSWNYSTAFPGKTSYVYALHAHGGVLHAAGMSSGFAGPMYGVNRLNGNYWQPVGGGFNDRVNALGSHDGKLVCAGAFTQPTGPTDPTLLHVAVYDNGWVQLGDGLDAPVHALLDVNGTLYAGGEIFENIAPRFGLARIAANAGTWTHPIADIPSTFMTWEGGATRINALAAQGDNVLFGGSFHSASIMVMGSCLGRLTATDGVEVLAAFNQSVESIALHAGSHVVVGGLFTQNGFAPVPHLGHWDLASGIADDLSSASVSIWPNPTVERLNIDLSNASFKMQRGEVMDVTGRTVIAFGTAQNDRLQVDVSQLADATYTLTLIGDDGIRRTGRFVKH
ncbi:MAG TPA: T9SS type A sorting domain-containing protein [Flavobacteriales bacterium]